MIFIIRSYSWLDVDKIYHSFMWWTYSYLIHIWFKIQIVVWWYDEHIFEFDRSKDFQVKKSEDEFDEESVFFFNNHKIKNLLNTKIISLLSSIFQILNRIYFVIIDSTSIT